MNFNRSISKAASRQKLGGWTLLEMMISIVTGILMMTCLCTVFIFMNRNLNATANYEELDRQSRNAIDIMTRDIRQAGGLTNFTTSLLQFTNQDGSLLQYKWDTTNSLTYTNASTANGGPFGGTLLKGCSYLKFSIFQRNPSNGTTMDFWPAATPDKAKVILINLVASRTNYTSLTNSESVQTAKVVLRN